MEELERMMIETIESNDDPFSGFMFLVDAISEDVALELLDICRKHDRGDVARRVGMSADKLNKILSREGGRLELRHLVSLFLACGYAPYFSFRRLNMPLRDLALKVLRGECALVETREEVEDVSAGR